MGTRVKIACIVPRYGAEITEGPAFACRLLAERLADSHDVEVLTTCAREADSWKNVYPEGTDRIRGAVVRRFATADPGDAEQFRRYSAWLLNQAAPTPREGQDWVRRHGPWCPALVDYLKRRQRHFDLFVFFSYRHATTIVGMGVVEPSRTVLVPWVDDEAPLVMQTLREPFATAGAIVYVSEAERMLVKLWVPSRSANEDVLPWGIDPPPPGSLGRRWTEMDERDGDRWDDFGPATPGIAPHLTERGAEFRRRMRLYDPFVLCTARVTPGDGVEEAFEYFSRHVAAGGTATLVLTGDKAMRVPEEPWVRFAGHLSETDQPAALEAASVVLAPCPSDTLALDALRGMAMGTAVLATSRNAAAVEHCRRGQSGLFYGDGAEFVECLQLLMDDEPLRNALGKNGREYVQQRARWDAVLDRFDRLVTRLRTGRNAA